MDIKKLVKNAHDNAVKIRAYDCVDCEGEGFFPIAEGYDVVKCSVCKGSGKTAKDNVYEKITEESIEFIKSKPSETFHKDSEQSEIGDIFITLLAYCGEMNYDAEKIITEKIEFNKTREYKL